MDIALQSVLVEIDLNNNNTENKGVWKSVCDSPAGVTQECQCSASYLCVQTPWKVVLLFCFYICLPSLNKQLFHLHLILLRGVTA